MKKWNQRITIRPIFFYFFYNVYSENGKICHFKKIIVTFRKINGTKSQPVSKTINILLLYSKTYLELGSFLKSTQRLFPTTTYFTLCIERKVHLYQRTKSLYLKLFQSVAIAYIDSVREQWKKRYILYQRIQNTCRQKNPHISYPRSIF